MQVGLNAQHLSFGANYRGAGISRYIRNLLPALRREGSHRYGVYLGDPNYPPDFVPDDRFQLRISRLPTRKPAVRILWEQVALPALLLKNGDQAVHALSYVQPLLCPAKSVVTIHDLTFISHPSGFNRANQLYLSRFTRWSARRADHIIAVSHSTRADVVSRLGIAPARVSVVHHGIEPQFRPLPKAEVEAFRRRKGLPERFLLFFGTIEPRKNLVTLVEAFARVRNSLPGTSLVIAGGKGWQWQPVFGAVEALGLGDDVHFPGYVPYEEQPLWYNAATVFVYPSLYEGFGFPVLEAMACGTPVISADNSSLPEVAGEAALYFQASEREQLATAIVDLMVDEQRREQLRQLGLARAGLFSWQRAAAETAAVYSDL